MSTATETERNCVKWTMTHPSYSSATLLRPLSSNLSRPKKCPDLWTPRDELRRRSQPSVWLPLGVRVLRVVHCPYDTPGIAQYNPRFARKMARVRDAATLFVQRNG